MKYLVIVGDDFGFTSGVNRGSLEALHVGILKNLSFMVRSPGSTEATLMVKQNHLEKQTGLHVTLNNLNKTGKYLRSVDYVQLLESETTHQLQAKVKDEFNIFEALFSAPPAFLNSHKNIHQHEKLREVFAEYAIKHNLFIRRTKLFKDPNIIPEKETNQANQFFLDNGVKITDHIFEPIVGTFVQVYSGFITDLSHLYDNSTTEIFFHPGYVDDQLRKYSSLTYDRERDLQILTNQDFKNALINLGYTLTSFGDLNPAS